MTQSTIQIPLPEPEQEPPEERNHNPYIVAAILALSIVVLLFYRLSGSQVVDPDPTLVGISKQSNHIIVDVDGAVERPGVYRLRVGSRVFDAIASAGGLKPNADKRQVNMAKKLRDEEKLIVPVIGQVLPTPTPSVTETPGSEELPENYDLPGEEESAPAEEPVGELTPAPELPEPAPSVSASPSSPATPVTSASPVSVNTPSPTPTSAPPVVPSSAKVSINRATADQLETIPGLGARLALEIVNYRKGPPPRAFTSLEELTLVPGLKQSKYEEILPYLKL